METWIKSSELCRTPASNIRCDGFGGIQHEEGSAQTLSSSLAFSKTAVNIWNEQCGSQTSFACRTTTLQGSTSTCELCKKTDCEENTFRKFINGYNIVNACHAIGIFYLF